jgi:hypothetical protein
MPDSIPETCARRLLGLSAVCHKTRSDGIILGRTLWQSFAAVGSGLEFALGLDHCLRRGWLLDYGARLVLTKAGYAAAFNMLELNRKPLGAGRSLEAPK